MTPLRISFSLYEGFLYIRINLHLHKNNLQKYKPYHIIAFQKTLTQMECLSHRIDDREMQIMGGWMDGWIDR